MEMTTEVPTLIELGSVSEQTNGVYFGILLNDGGIAPFNKTAPPPGARRYVHALEP